MPLPHRTANGYINVVSGLRVVNVVSAVSVVNVGDCGMTEVSQRAPMGMCHRTLGVRTLAVVFFVSAES